MSSKTPKVKFFPPIKTAASFLRTIARSPDISSHSSPHIFCNKEYIPDLLPFSSTKDLSSPTNRSTASRRYRDFLQLHEVLKSPEPKNSFYLPTSLDQLRVLAKSRTLAPRDARSREADFEIRAFEDSKKFGEGQNLENRRLREWLGYMKSQYLTEFFANGSMAGEVCEDLDAFKVVLKVAVQECVKQVSVGSLDRGEVVSELLSYTKLYCKVKEKIKVKRMKKVVDELEGKVKALLAEITKVTSVAKEKEEVQSHETDLLKSALMLKSVDIENLSEHVKKLKAERTYRIKKDLERYNKLLSHFNEYKQLALGLAPDPSVLRNLSRKRDSIKELVLSKLNLIQDKKLGSRLTEEQRIEHEMLTTDIDSIFFDKFIQVEIKIETNEKNCQAAVQVAHKEVLTDEILDIVQDEDDKDTDEILVQPNIMITNENLEEIAFSSFAQNLNEISIIEENNEVEDLAKPAKRKVNSMYRWRENDSKQTQTEEKVFKELARQEEEELLEWMIHDRKTYLKTVQKEIYHKKNELSRVAVLVSKSRSMLGESINADNSLLSTDDKEVDLEKDFEYLKSVGLLDREVEIESWKTGYYYGYEKGKNEAFVSEGNELMRTQDVAETKPAELESFRSKTKKNSLITDNIRSQHKGTKVQEFNFQHKDSKATTRLPNVLRQKYIEDFIQEPSKSILKQAKMSRKMMMKTIGSLYAAGILKKSANEGKDLATFTYDEFSARFGQQIAAKKLVEFLASVLKHPDSRKTINFAKLIGIGNKIGLEDYVRPKESFEFLLEFSAALQKSNLGITFNIEESLDYQFVPVIRAVDCTKEILSKYFDLNKIFAVVSKIEANSHPDPKKINKFGIIDKEFLVEMLLLELNSLFSNCLKAIWTLFEAFYSTRHIQRVFKQDFVAMVRYLSPDRFYVIGEDFSKIVGYDERTKTLPVTKTIDMCLFNNLLTPHDLEVFLAKFDEAALKESLNNDKENVKNALFKLFESKEALGLTEQYAIEWENRLERITETNLDWKDVFIVWQILKLEVERLSRQDNI